ncbi:hypothetical protein D3C81_1195040 [compost metagenome]
MGAGGGHRENQFVLQFLVVRVQFVLVKHPCRVPEQGLRAPQGHGVFADLLDDVRFLIGLIDAAFHPWAGVVIEIFHRRRQRTLGNAGVDGGMENLREGQACAFHRAFAQRDEAFVEFDVVEDHRAADRVFLAEGFPVINQCQARSIAVEQHSGTAIVAGGRQGDPFGQIGTGGVELAPIEDQLAVGTTFDSGLERELVLSAHFGQGIAETFAG